ncbi:phosphoribosyltransferase [Candidatus Micrarchaeota archaeon]|nr:phosphoribosyltransferase [Candidatus Micrarchaeota archaeon]MBU2477298.1 phosphoribosyltransferase [Candidatus Micrarchaeota archaeon]
MKEKKIIKEKELIEKLNKLGLKGKFDLIIGIGSQGKIPAELIGKELGIEVKFIEINFRNEKNQIQREKPLLMKKIGFGYENKKILLVDDFCNSGKTFEKAGKELSKAGLIKTLAVNCRNKKADYCLFEYQECIQFDWK